MRKIKFHNRKAFDPRGYVIGRLRGKADQYGLPFSQSYTPLSEKERNRLIELRRKSGSVSNLRLVNYPAGDGFYDIPPDKFYQEHDASGDK